jgi:hypothetical protein
MIHANLIVNKTRVVLHCTEYDTYVYVNAENRSRMGETNKERVEDLIRNLKSEDGNCRPGVEMLNLDYIFTQPANFSRRKRDRRATSATETNTLLPMTTTYVLSAKRWAKRLLQLKKQYECTREIDNEQRRSRIIACSRPKKTDHEGRIAIPILVIEGPWMLPAEHTESVR